MKIFVGCSQNDNVPNKYFVDCKNYLNEIFSSGHDLVFGGCNKGLMKTAYTTAKENGRNITGVSTDYYVNDLKRLDCDFKYVEKTEDDRHNKLIELADSIIFLPGGTGTISEIFTSIEGKRAKEFNKPIIIYNSEHFFDKLIEFLDNAHSDGFVSKDVSHLYYITTSAEDTLEYLSKLTKC